jgi:hypothetical protein
MIPDSLIESEVVTQLRLKVEASNDYDKFNTRVAYSVGALLGLAGSIVIWKNNIRAFSRH